MILFFIFIEFFINKICVNLLLQPRVFFFKKKQKKRTCLSFKNKNNYLNFGSSGLVLLQPCQLTANQMFRFKLFLKRASRKPDITRRFVWFHAFPHLPLTRKPKGIRMGKGKGKLECWSTNIKGGSTLVEFKNLRKGRSLFFIKQMTHKLGLITKPIFNNNYYLTLPLLPLKRVHLKSFW